MSVAGLVYLSDLIDQVRNESDQNNSQFVTDLEIATYLNNSWKELYDMLIGAYGEDISVARRASFMTQNNQDLYPLPDGILTFMNSYQNVTFVAPPFYKLLGLDYNLNPVNPQGYITLKSFPFAERNRFSTPNFASFWGFVNIRYRLSGNNLYFTPIPQNGQIMRIWYIPRPIDLVSKITGTSTIGSITINVTDILTPQVGMQFFGPGVPPNTTITAVGSTTITLSNPVLAGTTNGVFKMFAYTTQVDGISGWEEYAIVDAAMKVMGKEESGTEALMARKLALKKRIEDIAANRDPGTAARTADVSSGNIWDDQGDGGTSGFGGGSY